MKKLDIAIVVEIVLAVVPAVFFLCIWIRTYYPRANLEANSVTNPSVRANPSGRVVVVKVVAKVDIAAAQANSSVRANPSGRVVKVVAKVDIAAAQANSVTNFVAQVYSF